MTRCTRCEQRSLRNDARPDLDGCAFATGVFTSDNFRCGTLQALRDHAESAIPEHRPAPTLTYSDDHWCAVLPMPSVDDAYEDSGDNTLFVVLCWYKFRGRTERATEIPVFPDVERPLTLAVAERILARAAR